MLVLYKSTFLITDFYTHTLLFNDTEYPIHFYSKSLHVQQHIRHTDPTIDGLMTLYGEEREVGYSFAISPFSRVIYSCARWSEFKSKAGRDRNGDADKSSRWTAINVRCLRLSFLFFPRYRARTQTADLVNKLFSGAWREVAEHRRLSFSFSPSFTLYVLLARNEWLRGGSREGCGFAG